MLGIIERNNGRKEVGGKKEEKKVRREMLK